MTTGGNDWQGQLHVSLSIPGIGSGTMPGGGGGQLSSPAINDMANHLRRISGDTARQGTVFDRSLAKVGIKFNLAAILKQSQIFTSTLGSLFQIFGAVADIILAAFMPILVPVLRWIASQLPEIKIAVDKTVGTIIDILYWMRAKMASFGANAQSIASNTFQALGMNKEMADHMTQMEHDQAIVGGGIGLKALGDMLGDKKGGGFAKKWGNKLTSVSGGLEFFNWLKDGAPMDVGNLAETGAQVGGPIAALTGGGKVKGAGYIAMIVGEALEQWREGREKGDEAKLKVEVNGDPMELEENVMNKVVGYFGDTLEMSMGLLPGE